jgi:2-amino-4-hydroxy-6-hydroxymethyldihydropteridine diphosphokinase
MGLFLASGPCGNSDGLGVFFVILEAKIAYPVMLSTWFYMNGIYLITGGNMGNRQAVLEECARQIGVLIGPVRRASGLYETAAWGKTDQAAFLNQVLYCETNLGAQEVLEQCLGIERQMGRVREVKWSARIIDIDILFYGDEIIRSHHLQIPHPHIPQRRFVLEPLCEIAPDLVHPVLKRRMRDLLAECPDQLAVRRLP